MIYLDNAATSFPKPKRVYERMDRFLREEAANPGRSGHSLSVAAEAQIVQARSLLAKFFGAKSSERIIFTLNALETARKITVTKLRPSADGFIDPQDVKKALRKNTKLIVITHASNVIG